MNDSYDQPHVADSTFLNDGYYKFYFSIHLL